VLAAACGALALAPAAQAGVLVKSAGNCPVLPTYKPFTSWLDQASYATVPGGTFEDGAPGWTLSGAKVAPGNESYNVHGSGESHSLALPPGSSATSPTICVGLAHPTMRFFAKSSGGTLLSTLRVDVLTELSTGQVVALPIGLVTRSAGWRPTPRLLTTANLLALLPGQLTPVAFRFTPQGGASWAIDDVHIDPQRH
jgi:hypothetical protein